MQISINGKYQDNKGSASGWHGAVFNSLEEFTDLVKKDHCPSLFAMGERLNSNFISTDFLYCDIDGGCTLEEFREIFKTTAYYIATSKSHLKPKKDAPAVDRFHVFFPQPTPIKDPKELSAKLKELVRRYVFLDKAVTDPARFFHGNIDTLTEYNPGESLIIDIAPPAKPPKVKPKETGSLATDQKSEIMQALILAYNSGHFSAYEDWIKIGLGLKAGGFSVNDWMMLTTPETPESETLTKWATFDPKEVSLGTCYEYARKVSPDLHRPGAQGRESVKLKIGRLTQHPEAPLGHNPLTLGDFTDLAEPPTETALEAVLEALAPWITKSGVKNELGAYLAVIKTDPDFASLLRYNEATGEIRSAYDDIDGLQTAIMRRCSFYGLDPSPQRRRDIISLLSQNPLYRYNSILDLINRIMGVTPGDGIGDLKKLLGYMEFNTEEERPYITEFFDLWFKRTAVHILSAFGNKRFPADWCPVFVGRQGVGKSRLCRLFSPDDEHFIDLGDKIDAPFGSANFSRMIAGKIIGELGEMSVMGRAEVEVIKAGISATEDEYTPKYKEGTRKVPRVITFMGTSNNASFLKDMTGNRRFWPIAVKSINEEVFTRLDLLEKIWSYYLNFASKLIPTGDFQQLHAKPGLEDFFTGIRAGSVDIGITGDVYQGVIIALEKQAYLEAVKSGQNWVKLVPKDIAQEAHGGDATKAPHNAGKLINHIAQGLGYETGQTLNIEGKSVRGMRIKTTDPSLITRVRGEAEIAPWDYT
jgi:hypothetical protein